MDRKPGARVVLWPRWCRPSLRNMSTVGRAATMVMDAKVNFLGRDSEAGFTLVELLIVILIVGILSAVALPLYLGYTKDARLAEGKALGGAALTALWGCARVTDS